MRRMIILLVSITLIQGIALGQVGIQRKVFFPTFISLFEYRSWERSEGDINERVSQISLPTLFKIPMSRNVAFDVIGSAVSSSTGENSLSGFRDVRARMVGMFLE
ncbi:TPA: hypothetical protein EYP37_11400, partial [Candidatus Poribacteria bacterium]|nr:hypothetical protein [Candidatus Poribacteria bacterium]